MSRSSFGRTRSSTGSEASLENRCRTMRLPAHREERCHHKLPWQARFSGNDRGGGAEICDPARMSEKRGSCLSLSPICRLCGDEDAYYEPGGGYVRPEQTIAALLSGAKARGATIKTDTKVLSIARDGSGFRAKAAAFDVLARSVIVATGAWVSELSPSVTAPIVRICRQALHWFPVTDPSLYCPGLCPTFYWTHGASSADQFYGFPPIDGSIKVAVEQYTETWDPNDLSRDVDPSEQRRMSELHVAGRLAGVAALPTRSKACLYSVTQTSTLSSAKKVTRIFTWYPPAPGMASSTRPPSARRSR